MFKKKQRILLSILTIFIFGIFSSCEYNPQVNGELRSNGYIQYSFNGKKVFIPDSVKVSDPAVNLLDGIFTHSDSVLTLRSRSWPSIYVDGLLLQVNHCSDTGVFVLGSSNGSFAQATENGVWSTDSTHQGELHLTLLDTIRNLVSGTFQFWGKTKNNLQPDSAWIDSGRIINFPIINAR
jgi:hypothetical protein